MSRITGCVALNFAVLFLSASYYQSQEAADLFPVQNSFMAKLPPVFLLYIQPESYGCRISRHPVLFQQPAFHCGVCDVVNHVFQLSQIVGRHQYCGTTFRNIWSIRFQTFLRMIGSNPSTGSSRSIIGHCGYAQPKGSLPLHSLGQTRDRFFSSRGNTCLRVS
jgi:hypothetical protein